MSVTLRYPQHTEKLMSDSPRLLNIAVRLVDLILHMPDGQVKVLGKFLFETVNLIHCTCKHFFFLAE